MKKTSSLCQLLLFIGASTVAAAGADSFLQKALGNLNSQGAPALGQEQVVAGLKEALGKGVSHAVSSLNREGGFLTNVNVRIEIPAKMAPVEKTLRALNQGYLVDEFKTNMNRAAEIAVGQAGPLFALAVTNMTIADAENILHGPEDAATQYFRKVSESALQQKMLPIIQEATAQAGATKTYKAIMDKAQLGVSFLKNFEKPFDLDGYVNQKASDGLFKMIAEEEKRIRQNPAGQASELLQKVFGKVMKP